MLRAARGCGTGEVVAGEGQQTVRRVQHVATAGGGFQSHHFQGLGARFAEAGADILAEAGGIAEAAQRGVRIQQITERLGLFREGIVALALVGALDEIQIGQYLGHGAVAALRVIQTGGDGRQVARIFRAHIEQRAVGLQAQQRRCQRPQRHEFLVTGEGQHETVVTGGVQVIELLFGNDVAQGVLGEAQQHHVVGIGQRADLLAEAVGGLARQGHDFQALLVTSQGDTRHRRKGHRRQLRQVVALLAHRLAHHRDLLQRDLGEVVVAIEGAGQAHADEQRIGDRQRGLDGADVQAAAEVGALQTRQIQLAGGTGRMLLGVQQGQRGGGHALTARAYLGVIVGTHCGAGARGVGDRAVVVDRGGAGGGFHGVFQAQHVVSMHGPAELAARTGAYRGRMRGVLDHGAQHLAHAVARLDHGQAFVGGGAGPDVRPAVVVPGAVDAAGVAQIRALACVKSLGGCLRGGHVEGFLYPGLRHTAPQALHVGTGMRMAGTNHDVGGRHAGGAGHRCAQILLDDVARTDRVQGDEHQLGADILGTGFGQVEGPHPGVLLQFLVAVRGKVAAVVGPLGGRIRQTVPGYAGRVTEPRIGAEHGLGALEGFERPETEAAQVEALGNIGAQAGFGDTGDMQVRRRNPLLGGAGTEMPGLAVQRHGAAILHGDPQAVADGLALVTNHVQGEDQLGLGVHVRCLELGNQGIGIDQLHAGAAELGPLHAAQIAVGIAGITRQRHQHIVEHDLVVAGVHAGQLIDMQHGNQQRIAGAAAIAVVHADAEAQRGVLGHFGCGEAGIGAVGAAQAHGRAGGLCPAVAEAVAVGITGLGKQIDQAAFGQLQVIADAEHRQLVDVAHGDEHGIGGAATLAIIHAHFQFHCAVGRDFGRGERNGVGVRAGEAELRAAGLGPAVAEAVAVRVAGLRGQTDLRAFIQEAVGTGIHYRQLVDDLGGGHQHAHAIAVAQPGAGQGAEFEYQGLGLRRRRRGKAGGVAVGVQADLRTGNLAPVALADLRAAQLHYAGEGDRCGCSNALILAGGHQRLASGRVVRQAYAGFDGFRHVTGAVGNGDAQAQLLRIGIRGQGHAYGDGGGDRLGAAAQTDPEQLATAGQLDEGSRGAAAVGGAHVHGDQHFVAGIAEDHAGRTYSGRQRRCGGRRKVAVGDSGAGNRELGLGRRRRLRAAVTAATTSTASREQQRKTENPTALGGSSNIHGCVHLSLVLCDDTKMVPFRPMPSRLIPSPPHPRDPVL